MSNTPQIPTIGNPNGVWGLPPTLVGGVVDPSTQLFIGPSAIGATAATRYVGGTASGPPTTGVFQVGDWVQDLTGTEWICLIAGSPGPSGWVQKTPVDMISIYGDGSDGDVTLGAGSTNLTRDMFYDTLIVGSGATINNRGYRIFCRTLCWVQAGGKIQNNGGAGNATGAGGTSFSGSLQAGQTGGAGGNNAGSNSGGNVANSYGGASGAGGNGTSGSGGVARSAVVPAQGSARHLPQALLGMVSSQSAGAITWSPLGGGAGGGGGSGDATNSGGGGGAGGGPLILAARTLRIDGQVWAVGGTGGTPTLGNTGGGGGGGGGTIVAIYDRLVMNAGGNFRVYGGVAGVGHGTGTNGGTGVDGTVIRIRNRTPHLLSGEVAIPYTKATLAAQTAVEPNHRAFGNVSRRTSDGLLWAPFRTGNQHGPASPGGAGTDQGVLSFVKSTDNGVTWTAPANFYTDATFNCQDVCAMWTAAGTLLVTFFVTATDGTDQTNGCRAIRSTDGGATFDTPRALNDTLTSWSGLSCPAVQLSNGRLLQAVYGVMTAQSNDRAQICRSDDDGVTWTYHATLPYNGFTTDEPNLIVVNDNLIICLVRQSGDDTMGRSVSMDGGLTWTAWTTVIPATPFSMHSSPRSILTANGSILVLGRTQTQAGTRAGIFVSTDLGLTWNGPYEVDGEQYQQMVYGGFAEYSAGKIVVVYWLEELVQYLDAAGYSKRLTLGPA